MNGEGSFDGQTPIDEDEAAALLLPFRTREALNRAEEETILRARLWAEGSRMFGKELLTDRELKRIHLEMFRGIWEWAGEYRQTEKDIGIPWVQIPVAMKQLCDDLKYRVDLGKEERDSLAVEFHHRLVRIHLFPNGNGRHARFCAGRLVEKQGGEPFRWGRTNLQSRGDARSIYLAAIRQADDGELDALMAFARSGDAPD